MFQRPIQQLTVAMLLFLTGVVSATTCWGQIPEGAPPAIRISHAFAVPSSDCDIQVDQIRDGSGGYTIKIMVPDSIKAIEVVPNARSNANRDFRIRVERPEQDSAIASRRVNQPIQTAGIQQQRVADSRNPIAQPAVATQESIESHLVEESEQKGFRRNPFFKASFAEPQITSAPPQEYREVPSQLTSRQPLTQLEPEAVKIHPLTASKPKLDSVRSRNEDPFFNSLRPNSLRPSESGANRELKANLMVSASGGASDQGGGSILDDPDRQILVSVESDDAFESNPGSSGLVVDEPPPSMRRNQSPHRPSISDMTPVNLSFSGPAQLGIGEHGDFEVEISNQGEQPILDGLVIVDIPQGIRLAVLERQAFLQLNNKVAAWTIDKLAPGETETIRFRVVAETAGRQIQKARYKIGQKTIHESEITTTVSSRK